MDCDDANPNVHMFQTVYGDLEGDGYGDKAPSPGMDAGTDCDDSDETIFFGAAEVYGDGIDQDCDGCDPEIDTEWSEVETILSSSNCMGGMVVREV